MRLDRRPPVIRSDYACQCTPTDVSGIIGHLIFLWRTPDKSRPRCCLLLVPEVQQNRRWWIRFPWTFPGTWGVVNGFLWTPMRPKVVDYVSLLFSNVFSPIGNTFSLTVSTAFFPFALFKDGAVSNVCDVQLIDCRSAIFTCLEPLTVNWPFFSFWFDRLPFDLFDLTMRKWHATFSVDPSLRRIIIKSRRSGAGAAHYPAKQLPKIQIDSIGFF